MDECVPLGYEAISLLEALNGLAVAPRRPKQRRAISTNDCNQSEAVNCTQQNGVITLQFFKQIFFFSIIFSPRKLLLPSLTNMQNLQLWNTLKTALTMKKQMQNPLPKLFPPIKF